MDSRPKYCVLIRGFEERNQRGGVSTTVYVPRLAAIRGQRELASMTDGASRLRAAKSSTAVTCYRVMSNCSIISSMLIPSSRFSKMGQRAGVSLEKPTRRSLFRDAFYSGTFRPIQCHWRASFFYSSKSLGSLRKRVNTPEFCVLSLPHFPSMIGSSMAVLIFFSCDFSLFPQIPTILSNLTPPASPFPPPT